MDMSSYVPMTQPEVPQHECNVKPNIIVQELVPKLSEVIVVGMPDTNKKAQVHVAVPVPRHIASQRIPNVSQFSQDSAVMPGTRR